MKPALAKLSAPNIVPWVLPGVIPEHTTRNKPRVLTSMAQFFTPSFSIRKFKNKDMVFLAFIWGSEYDPQDQLSKLRWVFRNDTHLHSFQEQCSQGLGAPRELPAGDKSGAKGHLYVKMAGVESGGSEHINENLLSPWSLGKVTQERENLRFCLGC